MPVPSEEERQPGVNSFAESVMFCVINRRPACAVRVTVLGLCVCLPIQAQWNVGSFTMERHECSNDITRVDNLKN